MTTVTSFTVAQYAGGRWEDPAESIDQEGRPSPRDPGGPRFPQQSSSPKQIDYALEAAREAYKSFSARSVGYRAQVLREMSAALVGDCDHLADLLVAEVGKTLAEALGEIRNACRVLDFYAGAALRAQGESFESERPNTVISTRRFPLGVVALITPWNFPINLSITKIGPALAAGNSVVLKPAPEAAATVTRLVAVLSAVAEDNLITLVHGDAAAGEHLVESPDVDGISFTGSTLVGRQVLTSAVNRGVPCLCEMGGQNSLVVLPSADFQAAAEAAVTGGYRMAGQKCTATSRLVVDASVREQFVELLVERLATIAVGDPRHADTFIGPLISKESRDRVVTLVQDAISVGARLIWPPGPLIADSPAGWYLRPILIEGVNPSMRIGREEIFGPVIAVHIVDGVDEAVEVANRSQYGLTASVFTQNLRESMAFLDQMEAGTVLVNQPTAGLEFQVPFGGWKESGSGQEQGDRSLENYSRAKTTYLSW